MNDVNFINIAILTIYNIYKIDSIFLILKSSTTDQPQINGPYI